MSEAVRSHHLLRVLTVAVVLALGVVACSDDETSGKPNPAQQGSGTGSDGLDPPETKREKAAAGSMEKLYASLANENPSQICKVLTPGARRQFVQAPVPDAAHREQRAGTCADWFAKYLVSAKQQGVLRQARKLEVLEVDIDGDEAVATVSFGTQRARVPMYDIGGRWRFGTALPLPSVAPPQAAPAKKKDE